MNQKLILGHDIPDDDSGDLSRVTILCKPLAIELFDSPEAALGQSVVVFGRRFTVIGVSQETEQPAFDFNGTDKEHVAFFSTPEMVGGEGIVDDGFIVLRDNGTESHDYIIRMANAVLQPRHYFADDVEFSDLERVIERFETIFTALRVLTGLIAAISLVIAGAGIMNVLLASLRQRVQELGIRRAIGATRADIRRQLLLESTLLGGLGGAFGSIMAMLMVLAIGPFAGHLVPGWKTEISVAAAVTALLVSLSAGLVFGLEPARRAGKMDVIACLRGQI
jgi:putative ABC transport system permease protein